MEKEKLCFEGKPVKPEEQEQAWAIYLAILEALIKLDLEKLNWQVLVSISKRYSTVD